MYYTAHKVYQEGAVDDGSLDVERNYLAFTSNNWNHFSGTISNDKRVNDNRLVLVYMGTLKGLYKYMVRNLSKTTTSVSEMFLRNFMIIQKMDQKIKS